MSVVAQLETQAEIAQLPLLDLVAMTARMEWRAGCVRQDRYDQLPPPEDDVSWFMWLLMAGRGSGKTRTGAEDAWSYSWQHPLSRYAVIGPTSDDCRKTCFEGESGIIARCPPELVATWNRGEKILTLRNGSMLIGYSADEPDRLRGPQHHRAWCDELAAWRYLDETLDNLLMGLRLGDSPRLLATSTPRPIKRLREIVADPTTWVTTVSTYKNASNLPRIFLDTILKRYEGTRLGRQELNAEILTDVPGALWQRSSLDEHRVVGRLGRGMTVLLADGRTVHLSRIAVAVDPASGGLGEDAATAEDGDEVGIVVVGLGDDGFGYVLADCTLTGSPTPGEWGKAVVRAYDDWQADMVVYEANQGGEMVRHTVVTAAAAMRQAEERPTDFVPTSAVWASRGKVTRAEPVSALYEQGRVRHVGTHGVLEDQMCEFKSDFDRRKMGYSPDRVDALVWGVWHLMLSDEAGLNVQEFYRQENSRHAATVAAVQGIQVTSRSSARQLLGQEMVPLVPPEGIGSAFGRLGNMYTVGADGLLWVHPEDVPPLLSAGHRRHQEVH